MPTHASSPEVPFHCPGRFDPDYYCMVAIQKVGVPGGPRARLCIKDTGVGWTTEPGFALCVMTESAARGSWPWAVYIA
jgi:hypothetical protein